MCKAGFAGDDAPRAVFRKSSSSLEGYGLDFQLTTIQLLSLADLAIMGMADPNFNDLHNTDTNVVS